MNTETFISDLLEKYPSSTVQDVCKALYQSCYGCGHFVDDVQACKERITTEYASLHTGTSQHVEPLDGNYVRLCLSILDDGMSADTLASLFAASARKEPYAIVALEEKLSTLKQMIADGRTPFDPSASLQWISDWKDGTYLPISHSERYRNTYHPSYRVIHKDFVPYIPVLLHIDRNRKDHMVIAIDGHCGAGKTTLGVFLKQIYGAAVVHVDDFYLQKHQRTQERYSQPGGNFDRERLEEEVLIPLHEGKTVRYHWFDCSTFSLSADRITLPDTGMTVIEGSYSMYPDLRKYYDCSIFVDIDPSMQIQRIARRNPDLLDDFRKKWIPLENAYFEAFDVQNACDTTIKTQ